MQENHHKSEGLVNDELLVIPNTFHMKIMMIRN